MSHFVSKILRIFVYNSLNISLAACLFVLETSLVLKIETNFPLLLLVFSSTILTYSLHRIVGLDKVLQSSSFDRFHVIKSMHFSILISAIISGVVLTFLVFSMPWNVIKMFVLPGLISLFYVLPVLANKRRLRDLAHIKIFLIAFVWSYTAMIPMLISESIQTGSLWILIMIEKFLFIFAITLPFDERDKTVDNQMKVKTLATSLGSNKTKCLSLSLIVLDALMWMILLYNLNGNVVHYFSVLLVLILIFVCINFVWHKKSDLYFSGLLDALIAVRSIIIGLAFYLY